MKHGDKKQKTAKASRKASAKKSAGKVAAHSGKGSGKGRGKPVQGKTKAGSAAKPAKGGKSVPSRGDAARSGGADAVAFSNPVVASAFKRAIKRYPVAFKRLAD
jgi:hypothetical protein